MKNIAIKVAAALVLLAAPAYAGKNGSAEKIQRAVASGSSDAIVAEIERAEALLCADCIDVVTRLTEDPRYAVREVAAWWLSKRPALMKMLAEQFTGELATGDTTKVRNAADFLGRTRTYAALPGLAAAARRDLGPEAKLALVRAAHYLATKRGNDVLTAAMADRDAGVRAAAALAWRDILEQTDATPVVALLADPDARVRAEAASAVGGMAAPAGRAALEALVVSDASATVRRNAAWALGKLGQSASRAALTKASADESGLVRLTAKAALAQLR